MNDQEKQIILLSNNGYTNRQTGIELLIKESMVIRIKSGMITRGLYTRRYRGKSQPKRIGTIAEYNRIEQDSVV